ncbi:MAG: type IV pilin protein [Gammaproteobacteria bacterium]
MNTKNTTAGFTLIELMVTVAIVSILAMVALPSYNEYVMKSRRSDAKAALLDLQIKQEKYRANCPQYASAIGDAISCVSGGAHQLNGVKKTAGGVYVSPDEHYALSIVAAGAAVYSLRATRTGKQTGDKCGDFQINQNGIKSLANASSGYDVAKCW